MGRKILFTSTVVLLAAFLAWGVLSVNLIITDSFNNMNNERYTVNYNDIKEKVGIDLESFSTDEAYLKSYNSEEGLVLVLGKYYFNCNNNIITKYLAEGFYFISNGVNSINDWLYNIFY